MAVSTRAVDTFGLGFLAGQFRRVGAEPVGDRSPGGSSGEVKMAGFLFLQSEGLTNHLAASDDTPDWLQGLIFCWGHGEYFAELGRPIKIRGGGGLGPAALQSSVGSIPHQWTWMVASSSICLALAGHTPRRAYL
jgi:hypothetical protein